MDYAKVRVMFDEFPFLKRYWSPDKVDSIEVRRWNQNLLHCSGYFDNFADIHDDKVYILDKDGKMIFCHPQPLSLFRPRTWLYNAWSSKVRFLIDELRRAKVDMNKVYWAVRLLHTTVNPSMTIYKPPANFDSVAAWLEDEIAKARNNTPSS